ncbi:hAT family dimerization domain-containing protein [Aspergillus glaucus CBS 516.65]|uniref:HAT C-terminal dimerisation domain-containing protein n=1 Tax=Aspergillus glaucus CBS 516.65 TaxID=1160497 RepID=A0A1L9V7F7_ASPGL|nr:hypothetical protein ASPGLDRAFT_39630 [Aspergillus glaucus CBS 516.65]OJJ79772.1 hypothetical protein ASPGLDRAFT_39630 [Aspergillus glaucus CBS 516.65]
MKKVFAYYSDRFPATEEEPYQPLQLSGLDWARHHSKRRRLSPSQHQNTPGRQFGELQRYLDENVLVAAGTPDVLAWWRENSGRFPVLSRMVQDFFSVPVSGVGVENLFSVARDVCHYQRNRLAPEMIEAIMLQMCVDRFEMKKEFQFQSEGEEYNSVSSKADEIVPELWISDVEDADGFDEEEDDENEDENEDFPAQPAVSITRVPLSSNSQLAHSDLTADSSVRPRRTTTTQHEPGHYRNLNNGR